MEKEISYWKIELQEKARTIETLKENTKKYQNYEAKYNELLKKYISKIGEICNCHEFT